MENVAEMSTGLKIKRKVNLYYQLLSVLPIISKINLKSSLNVSQKIIKQKSQKIF